MKMKYFKIRMALLTLGLVVMGYMLATTSGLFSFLNSEPDYAPYVQEGTPIVEAVHKFRADRGLWPQYLEDLVPAYLADFPNERWYFQVDDTGPSLSHPLVGVARTYVGYDFDDKAPSWKVFGSMYNRTIKTVAPVRVASTQPVQEIAASRVRELERRIRREPTDMMHRRDLASVFLVTGKVAAAREAVTEAAEAQPNHFWPKMARARIELDVTNTTTATAPATQDAARALTGLHRDSVPIRPEPAAAPTPEFAAFIEWANANPSFTAYYYVFNLWQDLDPDQAILAIETAMRQPLEIGPNDFHRLDFYCFDFARYLLKHGKADLAIALCDAWQTAHEARRNGDASYLALRAGAYLQKAEFDKALADIDLLAKRNVDVWAKNQDALRAAIVRKDKTFIYDPGNNPPTFAVFDAARPM